MSKQSTIFVQVVSYRDAELILTLQDLFKKAKYAERLVVGLCEQHEDEGPIDLKANKLPEAQIRRKAYPFMESKGVCWARHQVQKLYDKEDFTLAIDSHMRFEKGWDEKIIKQWEACKSARAVITGHPPGYTLPDRLSDNPVLSELEMCPPTLAGDVRFRGKVFTTPPKKPVRGKFVAPGFWFAKGGIIEEVPYDPYLYYEQEELCISSRFYTHGWDVFHPSEVICYHFYTSPPPLNWKFHWHDHADWSERNQRALARRDYILGRSFSGDAWVTKHIELYGQGDVRTLEQYSKLIGLDLSEVPKPKQKNNDDGEIGIEGTPSYKGHEPVENFQPKSFDILENIPRSINAEEDGAPEIMEAPDGVLVIKNYASEACCKDLRDYADTVAGKKLQVINSQQSTADHVVEEDSTGRITDYVNINGRVDKVLTLFIDMFSKRLAPYFGVDFEWFERPQLLRYSVGGKYDPHADADGWHTEDNCWYRVQDRDISVLLYLNDDYEGGEIEFTNLDWKVKPERGMLIAFPSDHRYLHAARPTTEGMRYALVTWSAVLGSPRVLSKPPYATVYLNTPPD